MKKKRFKDRNLSSFFYGLFTLPELDNDSDSDSDCNPNGYIIQNRTFYSAWSQIEIPIIIVNYRNGIGIESKSESGSVNVN